MSRYESLCSVCDHVIPDERETCAEHDGAGVYMKRSDPPPATENVYETGHAHGKLVIVIRRKPSGIPWAIDRELIELAGTAFMDGPNSCVTYEFLLGEESFLKACEHLDRMGWVKR